MIKCLFVLRKKPEMTKEEFHAYWKNVHGPLVSKLPGIVKYSQHHVMSVPRAEYEAADDPIDGIVETWWESEEALFKLQGTPELNAVIKDEMSFSGHTTHFVHTLLVTETVEVVK